ncbi:MAG: ADP-ribose pyrophosphatase [Clostridiaceae bacterium]|nr:ADP-ribose pyrophosphatase [Clostridiaceae bacterium]
MNPENFSILDGIPISIFSMIIVFIVLILLAAILSLLKYLPSDQTKDKKNGAKQNNLTTLDTAQDEEERLVAMLVASCVAKETIDKDVRIVSIERTK